MVNLICFFITAEFTLFSCLFYSPLIQNSRYDGLRRYDGSRWHDDNLVIPLLVRG
ncbi:hypothetical protein [Wolbachia endosymbiont (group B) of Ennomos erosarius]|uniref:hypothetical protein n=1 Tax=Wolbachia endosymbiont (group B) of Ennomos erosarius TaxID=3066175 RepID=UPI0031332217